jgi:hypothetical protein
MVSITVQLNFDYALSFRFFFLWQLLTDTGARSQLSYIEANRPEVEAEYQLVLKQAEENRQYWEERSREHLARTAKRSPKPGQEALWAKLQAQKARHELEA